MGRRQLIVVLVLAVAACGDASEGSGPTGESPADGSGVECIPTPESAESIAEGFTVTGATLENPFAVELPEENALGLAIWLRRRSTTPACFPNRAISVCGALVSSAVDRSSRWMGLRKSSPTGARRHRKDHRPMWLAMRFK